jgi:hypothetical protein
MHVLLGVVQVFARTLEGLRTLNIREITYFLDEVCDGSFRP